MTKDEYEKKSRDAIKKSIMKCCTPDQQQQFRMIYADGNLNKSIDGIVDDIPTDALKSLMKFITDIIYKNIEKLKEDPLGWGDDDNEGH